MSADQTFFQKFVMGGLRSAMGIAEGQELGAVFTGELPIPKVVEELQKAIRTSTDPKEAPRLAMLLTCILAHQNGWGGLELAAEAQAMWKQTEGLHRSR
jgi:hypothetical protein